ncbi:hypothetical protein [Flavobacterium caeni]|uniref:Uncharacterized protein n=1 Tax=Flavobacterium caeni TaxID=490189 RepID=A0A1G5AX15_9FLAO|nr:hypothetical protein [Flavobacterium caeni]SCX82401.1 hypothetical protein SAMN02927903_00181 [Flavobacterium caeni]
MTVKKLLFLLTVLLSVQGFAQKKTFAYSQIQTRNDKQQWGDNKFVGTQLARFTDTQIDVKADKDYHLSIVSKTDLPDNGVIYLCKDEKSNQVTVMLIDNVKMYLYSQTKRFLINFDVFSSHALMADSD